MGDNGCYQTFLGVPVYLSVGVNQSKEARETTLVTVSIRADLATAAAVHRAITDRLLVILDFIFTCLNCLIWVCTGFLDTSVRKTRITMIEVVAFLAHLSRRLSSVRLSVCVLTLYNQKANCNQISSEASFGLWKDCIRFLAKSD